MVYQRRSGRLLVDRAHSRAEVYAVDGEGCKLLFSSGHDESEEFIGAGEGVCPERLGVEREPVQARTDPFIGGQSNGDEFVRRHWGRL